LRPQVLNHPDAVNWSRGALAASKQTGAASAARGRAGSIQSLFGT
jgi:hypothetical protein